MRLLVFGAAGQLGADLVTRAAESEDHSVQGFTRADLDITDPDAVAAVAGMAFDVAVNCAAYNDTAGAESDPGRAFAVNGYAPERLAAAVREAGARFVHISTDYVFDGEAGRPYQEADRPAPLGVYGASKLVGEVLARRAHPGGTIVVRTAALFGLAGRRTGNFIETVLKAATREEPLRVIDDVVVSPTSTADLAAGLLALLRAGAEPGLYHLVNRGQASWFELAVATLERAGLTTEVEPVPASGYPSPVRRPRFSVLDPSRAEALGGPMPHWRDGLSRYLAARAEGGPGEPASSADGNEAGTA